MPRHPVSSALPLALAAAMIAAPAHAGRPLQTEDAGVLERGACEIEGIRASGVEINGKTELWSGTAAKDQAAPALTLAYAVASVKVSGDKWRHAATELNLAYSRPVPADLTLHANLGHARDEIGKGRATTWGLALEHAGFGAVAPMAELFGDDREAPWWNLGLRYTAIADKLFFDTSYGRQMAGARPTLITVGFKFAY